MVGGNVAFQNFFLKLFNEAILKLPKKIIYLLTCHLPPFCRLTFIQMILFCTIVYVKVRETSKKQTLNDKSKT